MYLILKLLGSILLESSTLEDDNVLVDNNWSTGVISGFLKNVTTSCSSSVEYKFFPTMFLFVPQVSTNNYDRRGSASDLLIGHCPLRKGTK